MNINHAMVAAFERSRQPEKQRFTLRLFAMALMAVFFAALMMCLTVGVHVYTKAADVQARTEQQHLQSNFLPNVVHANDALGCVRRAAGPEGDALVLVEELESGTYETRLYGYKGRVCQEYAQAGSPYNPDGAIVLFESGRFSFTLEDGLLTVSTDAGTSTIALRCDRGARR